MARIDLYQHVTDQVLAALEAGTVPWRHPILGGGDDGLPRNLSGRTYRGVNLFTLGFTAWQRGYARPLWMTYRQAFAAGGHVRVGEKSSLVIFWKPLERIDPETREKKLTPVLKHFRVFNLDQTEGVVLPPEEAPPAATVRPFRGIAKAAALMNGFEGGPQIVHGGARACYLPRLDTVRLPEPGRFVDEPSYYATAFHELVHATGHPIRLDRGLGEKLAPFGSPDYSKEELVAEMGAACLCAVAGIAPATLDQQAAYVDNWLQRLRNDKRLVVTAAGAGQRAADWIQGVRPTGFASAAATDGADTRKVEPEPPPHVGPGSTEVPNQHTEASTIDPTPTPQPQPGPRSR
ncbi:MAG: zincin-like metallopeptidase domain-containing protein [Planctomycetota bacterium]